MGQDLQDLIDTAKMLCKRLEQAAKDEVAFCKQLQDEFEIMSWQAFKLSEEIALIKRYKEIQEEAS